MTRYIILLLILTSLVLLNNACHTISKQSNINGNAKMSERLEKISITDTNGRSYPLKDLAGKPIFLNFWATWCAPCVSEMGSIEALYKKYGDEVVFLAVSTEELDKIRNFRRSKNLTFDFGQLNIDYIDAYVVKLPTTILINKKGEIAYEEEGGQNWASHENEAKIKSIIQ